MTEWKHLARTEVERTVEQRQGGKTEARRVTGRRPEGMTHQSEELTTLAPATQDVAPQAAELRPAQTSETRTDNKACLQLLKTDRIHKFCIRSPTAMTARHFIRNQKSY